LTIPTLISGVSAMIVSTFSKFYHMVWILTTRYREAPRPNLRTLYIIAFTIASIVWDFLFSSNVSGRYIYVCICLALLIEIGIQFVDFSKRWRCGNTCPLVPMISIFWNFFLFGTVDALSWIITGGFILLGRAIYFTYRMNHSKLNVRTSKIDEETMLASKSD